MIKLGVVYIFIYLMLVSLLQSAGYQYGEHNATVQLYENLNERKRKVLEVSVKV